MRYPKVAVVVTHPIQHFCPLYRALTQTGEIALRVFFASVAGKEPFYDPAFGQVIRFQDDITAGFEHEFLPNFTPDLGDTGRISNAHLGERLSAWDPDVVHVYGYRQPISRDAMKWSRRFRRPILYCSDSELLTQHPLWSRAVKRIALPRIFSRCDGFLTVGDCNEEYYRKYGVESSRFFRCPFPIDEEKLTKAIEERQAGRRLILEKFNLPSDAMVLLIVGKLTERKAPRHAIEAVSKLWASPLKRRPFLVLAGNGPEADRLRSLANTLTPEAVRFAGFVEVSDLPRYYAAADLLVHPSSEDPHPLAISEAVFSGLPVIVSDRVGSVGPSDDVRVGVNGFTYPYGDVTRLAELVAMFCDDPELTERMTLASLEIGRQRTLRISTKAYIAAAKEVAGPKGRSYSSSLNPAS